MSKVFISAGHGGSDPGAVGYIKEADVNLNMALACRDYLEANGVEVKISRTVDENDDLNEEIRECNEYNPDLAVSIHNNAGGGDGCEVYHSIFVGKGKTLAENINQELIKIGQNSRGVKTRKSTKGNYDYYGFIRSTKASAVIVECVFVDNKEDAAQADTLEEQKTFGVAIAKGILKTLEIESQNVPQQTTPQNNTPTSNTEYTVTITTDVLNVRAGAGTNYKINTTVKKGEVYTIVSENNGWGKLKSGAGWISLTYTSKGNNTPTSNSSKYVLGLYVVNASGLNVRAGAGTNYKVIKSYSKGTRFDTYEIKNNWARTPSGWVCLDYCNLVRKY